MGQLKTKLFHKAECFFCFLLQALKFKKTPPTQTESILMAIEVLYLWKALPECSEDTLINMLKGKTLYAP